jgi:hypothetical protein
MKVSTKLIIVIDPYTLRLNHPHSTGWIRKIDRFLFSYYPKTFGLPCFLPFPKIKRQLVVDDKPVFMGGGVNCFNEQLKVKPVIVNKETLKHCIDAARQGWFEVRNFKYNGFYSTIKEGYANLRPKINDLEESNDPGMYKYRGLEIPACAIEGIQILYKPKQSNKIPLLFGTASSSESLKSNS